MWLVSLLPQCLLVWLQKSLPQWFLPDTVVVKKQKPNRFEDLANERHYHQLLKDLQGTYIPHLFGDTTIDSQSGQVPTLLLEFVRGKTLFDLSINDLVSDSALESIK